MNNFQLFLEIARHLNKINITPILYGSLGLSIAIRTPLTVNDVDILVPDEFIKEKWPDLMKEVISLDFELKDEKEHEFIRGAETIAFASYKTLEDVSFTTNDLQKTEEENVSFYTLSPEQCLAVYQYCLKDSYRQDTKKKTDSEKIILIENYLKKNNN